MAQIKESVARYLQQLDTAQLHQLSEALKTKTNRLKENIEKLRNKMQRLEILKAKMLATPDQQISLTDPDSAARRHRAGIGIRQRYLLVRCGEHFHLENLETLHLLLQLLDLLFQAARLGLERLGTAPAGRQCRAAADSARRSP